MKNGFKKFANSAEINSDNLRFLCTICWLSTVFLGTCSRSMKFRIHFQVYRRSMFKQLWILEAYHQSHKTLWHKLVIGVDEMSYNSLIILSLKRKHIDKNERIKEWDLVQVAESKSIFQSVRSKRLTEALGNVIQKIISFTSWTAVWNTSKGNSSTGRTSIDFYPAIDSRKMMKPRIGEFCRKNLRAFVVL